MTQLIKANVLIDTTLKANCKVETIYQLDVLVALSSSKTVTIREPNLALLQLIQEKRPEYSISFIID